MRNPVLIKPYRSVDEARCRDLLKQIVGDDDVSQRYYPFALHHAFLAVVDGRLVGLASRWDNPIHPYSLRSGVVVCYHSTGGRVSANSCGSPWGRQTVDVAPW